MRKCCYICCNLFIPVVLHPYHQNSSLNKYNTATGTQSIKVGSFPCTSLSWYQSSDLGLSPFRPSTMSTSADTGSNTISTPVTPPTSSTTPAPSLVISNIANLVPVKLDGTNYRVWKSLLEPILRGHRLLSFIDGSAAAPSASSLEYATWYEKDQMILSWINATLSLSALPYIVGASSAKEAWDALTRRFGTSSPSHVITLRRKLHTIKKGTLSMQEYLDQFKVLIDGLGAAGSKVSNDELFFAVLDGLPSTFNVVSGIIRYRALTPTFTFEEAASLLLDEELTLSQQQPAVDISALLSQRQPHGRGRGRSRGRGGRPIHTPAAPSTQNIQQTPKDKQAVLPAGQQSLANTWCQICERRGHKAIDCYQRMNYAYQGRHPPEKLAAMAASSSFDESTWYSDTGASHHITNDLGNLSLASTYDGSDTVRVGNGQGLQISHIGSSTPSTPLSSFLMRNILHCPTASSNLLSVSQFSKDNTCYFLFDETGFCVKDKRTGKTLHRGPLKDGLYPLHLTAMPASSPKAFLSISNNVWHQRLGHPSKDIQSRILSRLSIANKSSSTVCASCQLGKSHKLPFHLTQSISPSPLHLLHCDL